MSIPPSSGLLERHVAVGLEEGLILKPAAVEQEQLGPIDEDTFDNWFLIAA
ncbi:hypothetical protein [Natronorubrum halophilum]|uniref:hypothetical protein n=1 Tax=Natronorubrum halophilum TaxID=1702106 RepID=UPI0013CF1E15|nr:hypothetical protein [Natronorubrum halophilum]